jgi:hypothetical protein
LNSSLLWWEVILLDWLFPLVCHGLGGFSLEEEDEKSEMMEVYVNGFAEH